MTARYGRAPSDALLALLADGALLSPLRQPWTVAGLPLDLQLREGDQVHLYCGLTRLLTAQPTRAGVRLRAHTTYTDQPCAAALFRTWAPAEPGFAQALQGYLSSVQVDPRHVNREGRVQAQWMALHEPWIPLDREAVIGRTTSGARADALAAPAVHAASLAVDRLAQAEGWQRPHPPKGANELDQLAVDPQGRLVLVELKHARASEVVTAPLQALRYAWEWQAAQPGLLPALGRLLDARRRLGLAPPSTPDLTGDLRLAVAWGEGAPSAEVERRLRAVRRIVHDHLPPGLHEVELWSLREGRPVRA